MRTMLWVTALACASPASRHDTEPIAQAVEAQR